MELSARQPPTWRTVLVGEHTVAELRAGRGVRDNGGALVLVPASDLGEAATADYGDGYRKGLINGARAIACGEPLADEDDEKIVKDAASAAPHNSGPPPEPNDDEPLLGDKQIDERDKVIAAAASEQAFGKVLAYVDEEVGATTQSLRMRRINTDAMTAVRGWVGAPKAIRREIERLRGGTPSDGTPDVSAPEPPATAAPHDSGPPPGCGVVNRDGGAGAIAAPAPDVPDLAALCEGRRTVGRAMKA